jgi:hypothetical protein
VSDLIKIVHSETASRHASMYCLYTAVGIVHYGTLNVLSTIDTLFLHLAMYNVVPGRKSVRQDKIHTTVLYYPTLLHSLLYLGCTHITHRYKHLMIMSASSVFCMLIIY